MNIEIENKFLNRITSYLETYYGIVSYISFQIKEGMSYKSEIISNIEYSQGRNGLYILTEQLTDAFENKHKNTAWKEVNFFETIDKFLKEELKVVIYKLLETINLLLLKLKNF